MRPLVLRALIFTAIFLLAVFTGYLLLRDDDVPHVFHPSQLDPRLVDPVLRQKEGEHHILDFRLTDQEGAIITLNDLKGQVILADFFFTTCASICPKMSTQMARVQEAFKDDPRVVLLSHSVTPEMDSVPVLKAYAELHGAIPTKWHLMTGDRAQIYRLARKSYFAALDEGDGGPDDFVHTENFVLVDPHHRIRGFYDGTSEKEVDRAIHDIGRVLDELPDAP